MKNELLIVAEIGVNHNGDLNNAIHLIEAAKYSGANAVKFQTFKAESLVSISAPKVPYQISENQESHFEMIKKLELTESDFITIKNCCEINGLKFISTPYDVSSALFLDSIGLDYFKTASADLIDLQLHKIISRTGRPTIIATGMSTISEVKECIDIYKSEKGNVHALLHCVSNYPCSEQSINLNAMKSMANIFNIPIGFSDHSIGYFASLMAFTMGAIVIEKHFTLDKSQKGPDHKASSTPKEFLELVNVLRRAELILGNPEKQIQTEEEDMRAYSRKSLVTARNLLAGEVIQKVDIKILRPGTGIAPKFLDRIIGMSLLNDLSEGSIIKWTDLNGK
jgi:N,N'-diacetyllegionaminate synthase